MFIDDETCSIVGKFVKNNQALETIQAEFEIIEERIDLKFNEYIKRNIKKAHSAYIAVVLNSQKQWALPVSDRMGYNRFGVNFNEVNVVPMPGDWSIFIPKEEIELERSFLNGAPIDLLYSPFAMLYDKICEFRADEKICLYVYAQESSCAMMIFAGLKMLYADFFGTKPKAQIQEDDTIAPISIADIDNIIAKEDDKFSALTTLGELDEDEVGLDGGFEDMTKIEDIERTGAEIEEGLQRVGRAGTMINNIKEALGDFYRNEMYESDFVEKIVVFDSQDVLDETNFIEIAINELYIEATVFKVNRQDDLLSIIKRELKA